MERLFTNITNAGATTIQNKNMIQTGYHAGERGNFMRDNLYLIQFNLISTRGVQRGVI